MIYEEIEKRLRSEACEDKVAVLSRFFKTGIGEYGYGDRFLGVTVPVNRRIVKDYIKTASADDVSALTSSPYHEVRLAGFLLLVGIYSRSRTRDVVDFYLSLIDRGNNWDLVDLVAPKILGDWLVSHPEDRGVLDELVAMDGKLWHQRVAIVACWSIICNHEYDDTLRIVGKVLGHKHDLIHKASGWMLREVGKRGGMVELKGFLDKHAARMPRTMLRYAIEQLSGDERRRYMSAGK